MNLTKTAIWHETGFMIKRIDNRGYKNAPVFVFEDLNPEVRFQKRLSRLDRFKLTWWFFKTLFTR